VLGRFSYHPVSEGTGMKRTFLLVMMVSGIVFGSSDTRAWRGLPPQSAAAPPLAGRLYVTSWFGGVVSIVDLATGELRKTLPVGVQNHNVFLAPDRATAWVTNNADGTVSILDTANDAVVATVDVGVGPRHTYFSPDGTEAYVTAEFDNAVVVIDASTRTVTRRIPVGHMPHFALVAGDDLFVTNFGSGDVSVVRRRDGTALASIPVGHGPLGASITRDGRRVYVAVHNAHEVVGIDVATRAVIARIKTAPGPVQVTVSPDQRYAYVCADGRGVVQKIDLATHTIANTITIASDAGTHGISYAAGGRYLMVTNMGASTVSIIDTAVDQVVRSIRVATAPEGLAYLADAPREGER
jgi:YVTN family beta-propeller protein